MTTNINNTAKPVKPPHRGGVLEGVSIKNRKAFFECLEEGLQNYFDDYDPYWGGILHLTVGVKCGQVGGIIKGDSMLSYEGFTLERVRTILNYVLPQYVSRAELPLAVEAVIEELRMGEDEPEKPKGPTEPEEPQEPKKKGRSKKNSKL